MLGYLYILDILDFLVFIIFYILYILLFYCFIVLSFILGAFPSHGIDHDRRLFCRVPDALPLGFLFQRTAAKRRALA